MCSFGNGGCAFVGAAAWRANTSIHCYRSVPVLYRIEIKDMKGSAYAVGIADIELLFNGGSTSKAHVRMPITCPPRQLSWIVWELTRSRKGGEGEGEAARRVRCWGRTLKIMDAVMNLIQRGEHRKKGVTLINLYQPRSGSGLDCLNNKERLEKIWLIGPWL